MSKQLNPQISLHDVLDAANNCLMFVSGMSKESFEKDLKTISAVLHQLMVMGAATKRLGKNLTDNYPQIPWRLIAGTRDILIHHYEEADTEIVWNIVNNQLSDLVNKIEKILNSLNSQN